jgi:hypothetical protein
MTKLTPKKKAKRQEVRSERKAAKQQRKDRRELEQRNEPEVSSPTTGPNLGIQPKLQGETGNEKPI